MLLAPSTHIRYISSYLSFFSLRMIIFKQNNYCFEAAVCVLIIKRTEQNWCKMRRMTETFFHFFAPCAPSPSVLIM